MSYRITPVPKGSGGHWGIKGLYGFAHSDNEPAKKISVLLTSEGGGVGNTEGRRSLIAKSWRGERPEFGVRVPRENARNEV